MLTATFAALTFEDKKNAVRGEVIEQAHSGYPLLSPVLSLFRRDMHIQIHNAAPDTLLAVDYTPAR